MKNKTSQNYQQISNLDAIKGPFYTRFSISSSKISKAMTDFMNVKNQDYQYSPAKKQILKQKDFEILEFKNGFYQGDIYKNQRNGKGIYFWKNGQIYLGEWQNNNIQGIGILIYPSGAMLFAEFNKNKTNNQGLLFFQNGNLYYNEFDNGKLNGLQLKFEDKSNQWIEFKYNNGILSSQKLIIQQEETSICVEKFLQCKQNLIYKLQCHLSQFNDYENFKAIKYVKGIDESYYYGMQEGSLYNGIGFFMIPNESIKIGCFQNDHLNGYGHFIDLKSGNIKNGKFKDDQLLKGLII